MTLLLLSLLLPEAEAYSAGRTGSSQTGCVSCHGATADSTTTASFSASTSTVVAGDSLLVNFVVSTTSASRTKAGLNVSASGGTLAAGSNNRLSSGQITHSAATSMTSGSVTFSMTWTAPTTPGTYTLYGAGNAVNNNAASSGDGWNLGTYTITVTAPCTDSDGDGYTAGGSNCGGDCNDSSASINPGASETVADGVDQDCDSVDSCYTDSDNDNYGTTTVVDGSSLNCSTGTGAPVSTDCNDSSSAINPGASETVNDGVDQDCDSVDSCYTDADNDNYGTSVVIDGSSLSCTTGSGAPVSTDCNDGSASIFPGASETVADGVDQDCDAVDSCYTDSDNDNYGTSVVIDGSSLNCSTGTGAPVATDCNDSSSAINPGASETVNDGVDQDCDSVDSCYTDADNDNYGTSVVTDGSSLSCTTGSGAPVATDCNDSSASIFPGASETVADGVDQDCDTVDSCYTDSDNDNYGTSVVIDGSSLNCSTGTGAPVSTDCNDSSSAINPGASETVNDGVDQDCDAVDSCYTDADNDNYGTSVVTDGSSLSCTTGSGAPVSTDCNDSSASVFPGASESVADGVDQDCDTVDSCYTDSDNDNYGTSVVIDGSSLNCTTGSGAPVSTDCNDSSASINPGASESVADGVDQDCDTVDSCYTDSDSDNYGTSVVIDGSSLNCTTGSGAPVSTDCNDRSAVINPGATETVADGVDQDCDSVDSCYTDADNDNYGTTVVIDGSSLSCVTGTGAAVSTDCLDTNNAAYPGATDVYYDGVDADCAGDSDYDADADGYDSSSFGGTDCDDADPARYPGAPEIAGDGIIQDCNNVRVEDQDGDGADSVTYGGNDCDDGNADRYPGNTEIWYDGTDQDCDGNDDDQDEDGEGVASDCDDTDPLIYTGATELWYDGVDQDCNHGSDFDQDVDGYDSTGGDCNDTDATIYPGANDPAYDGIDQNCDLQPEFDVDNDGYDSAAYGGLDCDDNDATRNPSATETWYDGVDQDCSGGSDDDQDGDGEEAASAGGGDCDDTDSTVSTSATEVWYDGLDQNCDGNDDDQDGDGFALTTDCDDTNEDAYPGNVESWYDGIDGNCLGDSDFDFDGDGFDAVLGGGSDCDDLDEAVNPTASETWYDGADQNCDGASDYDQDGDGVDASSFGGSDCDDTSVAVAPGATEVWYDGVDQNCDGNDDDQDGDGSAFGADCDDVDAARYPGAADSWYDGIDSDCAGNNDFDADGDGEATAAGGGRDCDDEDAAINPRASEVWYNDVDENCDGNDDDQDGDGVVVADDCDDTDADLAEDCDSAVDSKDSPTDSPAESAGTDDSADSEDSGGDKPVNCGGCATGESGSLMLGGLLAVGLLGRRRK